MVFVKICPVCASTNISIPPAGLDVTMTFPDYCIECHKIGLFPKIKKSKIKDFKKHVKTLDYSD